MADSTEARRSRTAWQKPLKWALLTLAALAVFPVPYSYFVPWTRICCKTDEIDIQTGQARYSRYYWYIRYSREIRDTPLSIASGNAAASSDASEWRTVNTLSPGHGNSPHHTFHGALHQALQFEQIASMKGWGPDRRREVAERILEIWRVTGSYFAATDYLHSFVTEYPNPDAPTR